jgi:glycosyltransferase involved in cell wall biosynthesis
VVVDSESSDRTVHIARSLGAEVVPLPYEHSRIIPWIYQWSLDHYDLRHPWVLILEADQLVTERLRGEISSLLQRPAVHEAGFYVRRVHIFRGTKLRFGGYGTKRMLKLFRRDRGQLDPVEQDTRVYVSGPVGSLRGAIEEWNRKEESILFYLEKHLRYADAFAHEELLRLRDRIPFKTAGRLFGTPDQRILWQKTLWMRMPLGIRPFLYFFYRYVLLLGFLDGTNGFVLHFLQALWFRFVVDLRLVELRSSDPSNLSETHAFDRHQEVTTEWPPR